jgi:hypothetical protein
MEAMSTMSNPNKAAALAQVQALIAGIEQHFPNGSFTFGNTAYTTATLTQSLQALANAISDATAAHTRVKDAVLTLTATQTKVGPLIRDCKRFVLAAFSTAPQTLADFGMRVPKTRTPLTIEQRAAATAKMRSTRKARGTTSRKQKLGVKGDVTSVIITPVTEPHRLFVYRHAGGSVFGVGCPCSRHEVARLPGGVRSMRENAGLDAPVLSSRQ